MTKLSLKKSFFNDYVLFVFCIIPPIFLTLGGFVALTGLIPRRLFQAARVVPSEFALMMGGVFLAISLLAAWMAYRRFKTIEHRILHGIEAEAVITQLYFAGDRGRVDFEYQHAGQTYTTGTPILKNKTTRQFEIGATIPIKIDPQNHAKALIPELYV